MDFISTFFPFPTTQKVSINSLLVDQDMLCQLCRIVIEKATKGVYSLCDRSSEESILLGQIFWEGNKTIESSSLAKLFVQWFWCSEQFLTLNDGITNWLMFRGASLACWTSLFPNFWTRPWGSWPYGTERIQVLWSESILDERRLQSVIDGC